MLGEFFNSWFGDGEAFCLGPEADDGLDFIWVVGVGGDNEEAGEEIGGDAVCSDDVFGAADGAFASVGGENDDGGYGRFEGAVEVGEAFNIEHVDLYFPDVSGGFVFGDISARKRELTSSMKSTPGTSSATP